MELRTCTVREKDQKYVPVSRTSSRGRSASRADHPLCRGPETFWQGQTCSWLTKKSTGPISWAPEWVKFNADGTFYSQDTCMPVHTPPPPLSRGTGTGVVSPPEALASSPFQEQTYLLLLKMGQYLCQGKIDQGHFTSHRTYMLITAHSAAELGVVLAGAPQHPGGARRQSWRGRRGAAPHGVWGRGCTSHHSRPSGDPVCPHLETCSGLNTSQLVSVCSPTLAMEQCREWRTSEEELQEFELERSCCLSSPNHMACWKGQRLEGAWLLLGCQPAQHQAKCMQKGSSLQTKGGWAWWPGRLGWLLAGEESDRPSPV